MKKIIKLINNLIISFLIIVTIFFQGCYIFSDDQNPSEPEQNKTILGVWWWDKNLDINEYMTFAKNNNVTEIYYCSSSFDETTNNFISSAKINNIKVYWLAGEYEWIEDNSLLINKINKYIEYQNNYSNKFDGIHLDIEPHQHPQFDTKRNELITKFVNLTYYLKQNYSDLWIEYDLPFWLDDEVVFNENLKPAYKHIMDNASRVTLMSYRDTAESIYNVAKDEIEYAVKIGKTLNLGVETKSSEGDKVSFQEEGKTYMYNEIEKLRELVPENFGIVIHHIKNWKNLKD